jgi:hypothetical protein
MSDVRRQMKKRLSHTERTEFTETSNIKTGIGCMEKGTRLKA